MGTIVPIFAFPPPVSMAGTPFTKESAVRTEAAAEILGTFLHVKDGGRADVVLLLSGAATLVLDEPAGERTVSLSAVGSYVLVPIGVWHTARTTIPTTLLFLTPGAGTEHRPV
jgi:mannose-6-phosphate isomerase-like protein (cupin superfamily)